MVKFFPPKASQYWALYLGFDFYEVDPFTKLAIQIVGVRHEEVWVCGPESNPFPNEYSWGPPCMTEEKTIYVWAKNASKLELPEDVSFHLAPGSHIILALHYKNPGNTPKEITPGIDMVVTKKRTSKVAGVFQIINDYDGISPNRTGIIGNKRFFRCCLVL